ncbi:MAG: HesB/IscA family protein [Candidatus Villigracilaceae bacterium]
MTPEAAQAVQNLLVEHNLAGYALRVYVAGQSCHGIQSGLALDKEARPGDVTLQSEGVNVLVDNQSIEYLHGATIKFVNDPQQGAGFLIEQPNQHAGRFLWLWRRLCLLRFITQSRNQKGCLCSLFDLS